MNVITVNTNILHVDVWLIFQVWEVKHMEQGRLKAHPIEETEAYKLSWEIYNELSPNTSYIRKQVISRKSAASMKFGQADELNTTKSELTTIEGEGLRVNFFVSKCQFRCIDCFNELSQLENYGEKFTDVHKRELHERLTYPFVNGVTFVGGEPFQNAEHLLKITEKIKEKYPNKTIWSYTGFIIEVLLLMKDDDPRRRFLNHIDVLIDGQFIQEERDESRLKVYRGSSNQRLIDVQKTLQTGKIYLHKDN